jgi:hypothetical protein
MAIGLVDALKVIVPYAGLCCLIHFASNAIFSSRLKTFKPRDKTAFYNRTVSTFHAIVMFATALYYWIVLNPKMEIATSLTEYEGRSVLIMLGYLLYDTVFEALSGRQIMTLGHHVLGGASHISVIVSDNGAAGFYR